MKAVYRLCVWAQLGYQFRGVRRAVLENAVMFKPVLQQWKDHFPCAWSSGQGWSSPCPAVPRALPVLAVPAVSQLTAHGVGAFCCLSTAGRISCDSASPAWVRTVWSSPPSPSGTSAGNDPDTPSHSGLSCVQPLSVLGGQRETPWFIFPLQVIFEYLRRAAKSFLPLHCWPYWMAPTQGLA